MRPGDPGAVRQPGLPPPRDGRRGRPAAQVRGPRRSRTATTSSAGFSSPSRRCSSRRSSSSASSSTVGSAAGPGRATSPARSLINEFELASRLSYFLWSSMPDDELYQLALQGKLRAGGQPGEAGPPDAQATPKAKALVENFAGQWLQIRNLKTVNPDKGRFPSFDDALRAAMLKETELFFESIVREDRSVLDLIDANYTFLNERLAQALRDSRRQGRPVPPGHLPERPARGRPDAGERPDGHLEPDADLAREAGQVDPGADPRHSAAAAAAAGPRTEGRERRRAQGDAPPADGAAPGEPELRLVPRPDGPARVRLRELRRRSAPGATRTATSRSTPRARSPRARRSPGPKELKAILKSRERRVRPLPHREAAHLRPRPGA